MCMSLKNSLMLDITHLNSGCLHLKFSGTTYIGWPLYCTLMLWNQVVFLPFLLFLARCLWMSSHYRTPCSLSPHFESTSYSNSLSSFCCEMLSGTCHAGKDVNAHSCSNGKSCQVLEQGLQTGSVQTPALIFSYGYQCWRVWVYIRTQAMLWSVSRVLSTGTLGERVHDLHRGMQSL